MSQQKKAKVLDFVDRLNEELQGSMEPELQSDSSSGSSDSESQGQLGNPEKPKVPGAEKKPEKEDFASLLRESLKGASKKLSVGDKVRGKILVIGREDVFVSTGTMTDGVLAKRDLLDEKGNCPFKVNDVIDVYVTQVRGGEVRLSRKASDRQVAEDLEDAFDMMLPVQGRIVEVCKGGVRVNIKGKLAFCPISQIDTEHVEQPEDYVGKSFEFRVTQFSEGGRNIVVSRRKLLEEQREIDLDSFSEEHKDGDIVQGKVVRLEKFGAFVELSPGLDGLVHISEIAWSRIGDPSEVLQVGQEVSAKLLKRERIHGRMRFSLSIRQAVEQNAGENPFAYSVGGAKGATPDGASAQGQPQDPWSKYSVGQVIQGKVTKKETYGIFVQLEPGITGLMHKSRVSDSGSSPQSDFQIEKIRVGDSVSVQIAEIRLGERRISLCPPRGSEEDDWSSYAQKQPASTSFGTLGDQMKAALAKKTK